MKTSLILPILLLVGSARAANNCEVRDFPGLAKFICENGEYAEVLIDPKGPTKSDQESQKLQLLGIEKQAVHFCESHLSKVKSGKIERMVNCIDGKDKSLAIEATEMQWAEPSNREAPDDVRYPIFSCGIIGKLKSFDREFAIIELSDGHLKKVSSKHLDASQKKSGQKIEVKTHDFDSTQEFKNSIPYSAKSK